MLKSLFDLNNIAFEIFNYKISYTEFIAVVFGLVAVFLVAKNVIWNWPLGIISIVFSITVFYQVQLYSDMFLYVYFFVMSVYGWYYWNLEKKEKKISFLNQEEILLHIVLIIVGSFGLGFFMLHIHEIIPHYFPSPAAFPFIDSFIAVASVVAQYLMAKRKIEHWILWIIIDIVSVAVYFVKEIKFIAIEYLVFLCLACFGLWQWKKIKSANHHSH